VSKNDQKFMGNWEVVFSVPPGKKSVSRKKKFHEEIVVRRGEQIISRRRRSKMGRWIQTKEV